MLTYYYLSITILENHCGNEILFGQIPLRRYSDHAQKMWTLLLGNLVKNSFRNRKEFPTDISTKIVEWMDQLLDTGGRNANRFWLKFVSDNHKLLDIMRKTEFQYKRFYNILLLI